MSALLDVCIIGAGAFGAHHASKTARSRQARCVGVFDLDHTRAHALAEKIGAPTFEDLDEAIAAAQAVIIASPALTHANIARRALAQDRHVLVEKPLACSVDAAEDVVAMARRRQKVLQVGHQERFVFQALGLFDHHEKPLAISATREGPFSGRGLDVSAALDLMVHDIDLALRLIGEGAHCTATTMVAGRGDRADALSAKFRSETGIAIALTASRIAAAVKRTLRVDYPSGAVMVDLVSRSLVNQSAAALNSDFAARMPDPLGAADEAFFAACLGKAPILVPGEEALLALTLAVQAETLARSYSEAV